MRGPVVLGMSPAPNGLRAVYALMNGEEVETKILPVVSFARVGLPDQVAMSGLTLDPHHPSGFVLCQAHHEFVCYLNPGESQDDVNARVVEFVAMEKRGDCGHCGEKHPRKRRKR